MWLVSPNHVETYIDIFSPLNLEKVSTQSLSSYCCLKFEFIIMTRQVRQVIFYRSTGHIFQ